MQCICVQQYSQFVPVRIVLSLVVIPGKGRKGYDGRGRREEIKSNEKEDKVFRKGKAVIKTSGQSQLEG